MMAYGVMEVKLHAFLISALDVEDCLPLRHGHFTTAERAMVSRLFGGREDPGVATKVMEKKKLFTLPGIEPRPSIAQPVA
jgi:hypothetical protein